MTFRACLFALSVGGCAAVSQPCASAAACPTGTECLANRCAKLGVDPVPASADRWVVEPAQVGILGKGGTVPPFVRLGEDGERALLIRFPAPWEAGRPSIRSAFLLLEPSAAAPSTPDAELETWAVRGGWPRGRDGVRPTLAPPRSPGIVRMSPPVVARVDVTELVRDSRGEVALAVVVRDDSVAIVSSGTAGGAPRLEVYTERSGGVP